MGVLSTDEQNVEAMLSLVKDGLLSIKEVYSKAGALAERVESAYLELKDVREEASRLFEEVEFDPLRQQLAEERLSLLYALEKKHGLGNVDELIALREEIATKLQQIELLDGDLTDKEGEVNKWKRVMLEKATCLSKRRKAVVPQIEKQLVERLGHLKMPHARFCCKISPRSEPDTG